MQSSNATAISALALGLVLSLPYTARSFCFEEAGARYGVAPQLLWSISKRESGLNPNAVNYNTNGSYDFGLMQINTTWEPVLRKAGIPWNSLSDPCTNVMVGAWLLARHIQKHGYNWKAIGTYHSATPGKREKYARHIAKILASIKSRPVAPQQPANDATQTMLARGSNDSSPTP